MRKGIDVSQHNGEIDWKLVSKSVDFAIIRAGYGVKTDPCFYSNVRNAQENGVHIGFYWYSYALNASRAEEEAEVFYKVVGRYHNEIPCFVDLEDADGYKYRNQFTFTAKNVSDIANRFVSKMASLGKDCGVYASASWWENLLTNVSAKHRWVAHWGTPNGAGYSKDFSAWQYSSKGKIPGIEGDVDLNYYYDDYMKNLPASWAKSAWEKATAQGIVDGTRPASSLTRQELVTILDRLKLI